MSAEVKHTAEAARGGKARMKIAIATHLYPTPDRPDLWSDVEALHVFTRQWLRDGHEVTVLHLYQHVNFDTRKKPPFYRYWINAVELDGVRVIRIECRYIRRTPPLTWLYFKKIARVVNAMLEGHDILLAHFPTVLHGFAENLLPGAPRVAVLHSTDFDNLRRGGAWLLRGLSRTYAAVGFRSTGIRERFHRLVTWNKPEFMVYSGAPTMPRRAPDRADNGVFRVIYVGKLTLRKRALMVLGALAKLPERIDWRFTIVGEGDQRAPLEARIGELDVAGKVTLTGMLPRDEVLRLLGEQDAFAMVSTRETLGLVYLEAMGQGLLTIGSRGEGIDGIIEHGVNGFLADPDDEEALIELFIRIADLPDDEKARISNAARATASRMNEADMAAEYLRNAAECAGVKWEGKGTK